MWTSREHRRLLSDCANAHTGLSLCLSRITAIKYFLRVSGHVMKRTDIGLAAESGIASYVV